jgi:secreted PhoX family phosphatase
MAASVMMYKYLTAGRVNHEETEKQLQLKSNGFSFVDNPERNQQVQKIAKTYDEQIGSDETFMGINWW